MLRGGKGGETGGRRANLRPLRANPREKPEKEVLDQLVKEWFRRHPRSAPARPGASSDARLSPSVPGSPGSQVPSSPKSGSGSFSPPLPQSPAPRRPLSRGSSRGSHRNSVAHSPTSKSPSGGIPEQTGWALDAFQEQANAPETEFTAQEILEYAKTVIGMDPVWDSHLLWIAEYALGAPLPDGWTQHETEDGAVYYYDAASDESIWEHPYDEYYRQLYVNIKSQEEEEYAAVIIQSATRMLLARLAMFRSKMGRASSAAQVATKGRLGRRTADAQRASERARALLANESALRIQAVYRQYLGAKAAKRERARRRAREADAPRRRGAPVLQESAASHGGIDTVPPSVPRTAWWDDQADSPTCAPLPTRGTAATSSARMALSLRFSGGPQSPSRATSELPSSEFPHLDLRPRSSDANVATAPPTSSSSPFTSHPAALRLPPLQTPSSVCAQPFEQSSSMPRRPTRRRDPTRGSSPPSPKSFSPIASPSTPVMPPPENDWLPPRPPEQEVSHHWYAARAIGTDAGRDIGTREQKLFPAPGLLGTGLNNSIERKAGICFFSLEEEWSNKSGREPVISL
eukprot:tig00000692_g3265.t1